VSWGILLKGLAVTLMSFVVLAGSGRAVVIGFTDPQPVVMINQTARLSVSIDYGAGGTPGLFSYGISVLGDWQSLGIIPLGVEVPPPLDFNGIAGPGAFIGQDATFIGAKGTVDLSRNPIEMYQGTVLAEFQFRFTQPGIYDLSLDFFNTLGPTEQIFVNQDGMPIDNQIQFRPGQIQVVVPEPGSTLLLLAGAGFVCLLAFRWRRFDPTLPR
jgi:hypothetical protein